MLKIIGCSIILICSFIWGFEMSSKVKRESELTQALCGLVKRIGNEISILCRPLKEIYASFSDELLDTYSFSDSLRREGLSHALEKLRTNIPPEVYAVLSAFASALGGENREEQTALCKNCEKALSDIYEKQKEGMTERIRMYRAMPVLTVLCAVILII